MSEQEKQIEYLKQQFRSTVNVENRKYFLDTLARYGDKGATVINELLTELDLVNAEVKSHGLKVIREIKES